MSKKILVSGCPVGKKCAYDGKDRTVDAVKDLCDLYGCMNICPEMIGGLGCPREIHEIVEGTGEDVLDGNARVFSSGGKDHTQHFIEGAEATLEKAVRNGIRVAIMKARSPSCGRGKIYAGRFDGTLREGNGVTTALLLRHGIRVFTEEEVASARAFLGERA